MTIDLLNKIVLDDGRSLYGIVDYVNPKKIYFFDFSNQENREDFLLISILWIGNNPEMRYSVYCSIHYPDLKLPRAIIISRANITHTNKDIVDSEKIKQRKRSIK